MKFALSLAALAMGFGAPAQAQSPPSRGAATARADLSLWRLDCGEILINDYNSFFSDTSEYRPGPKTVTDSCYLIRHGDTYMLWDTGLPAALVGSPNRQSDLTARLRVTIADQLARIGVRPEQVSIVGISHYHFDHTGQAAAFPQARLVIGAGDLAALRGTDPSVASRDALRPWLRGGGQVTEARGDLDLFDDGSVVMLDLPGHTPGHHGLLVRLASGPVLLSGDTWHFTEQVARHGVPPFNTDRAQSLASMDRLERLARNLRARLVIQHEPADVAKLPAFPQAAR